MTAPVLTPERERNIEAELLASARERAERDRPRTAIHEGAHVAAYWHAGISLRGATIAPGLTYWGRAWHGRVVSEEALDEAWWAAMNGEPCPSRTRRRVEGYVVALTVARMADARAIAEGIVEAEEPPEDPVEAEGLRRWRTLEHVTCVSAAREAGEELGVDDDERVDELLRRISSSPAESSAYRSWLEQRAWTLVRNPVFWRLVQAVGAALVEHETLTGRECRQIICETLSPTPPGPRAFTGDGYFPEQRRT